MKPFSSFAALIIIFGACTQNTPPSDNIVSDTAFMQSEATLISDTLCFQRYSGLANQDTASVKIILDGNQVTGQYTNFPHEKDGRFGTITGTKEGDRIKGVWYYQQEGMDDSVAFEFKLQNSTLTQKASSFDRNTGKEFLSDTASFNLQYVQVNCEKANFTRSKN